MDRELIASLGVSLAAGLLIGLERQRAIVRKEGDETLLGGVRTFPLVALSGSIAALFSAQAWLVGAALVGLVALMSTASPSPAITARAG